MNDGIGFTLTCCLLFGSDLIIPMLFGILINLEIVLIIKFHYYA